MNEKCRPSLRPTSHPTSRPTVQPSPKPTMKPTPVPSSTPSVAKVVSKSTASSGLNGGAIAGIVIAVLVVLFCGILVRDHFFKIHICQTLYITLICDVMCYFIGLSISTSEEEETARNGSCIYGG